MQTTLILNARVINEGQQQQCDLLLEQGKIARIGDDLQHCPADRVIDAEGLYLLPGMIDDQVHFREPGLTAKGDIATESAAAVAGGITSYMEMPNVSPPTLDLAALEAKYQRAEGRSLANYAFYLGASNSNIEQIRRVDPNSVCGVKVFMGASTGDLLVDDELALELIFRDSPVLIATHCEDSLRIADNLKRLRETHPGELNADMHPQIRDVEACYASSSKAVELAKRFGSNLHVLHLTTAKELALFQTGAIEGKRITAEACVHHLWFSDQDYAELGNRIKCNPAVKSADDRAALRSALLDGRLDIVATDHAPHLLAEKEQSYESAPAGLPLVEHALPLMLELAKQGVLSLEQVVEKVSHNPAIRYAIEGRGFIREGYAADLVLVDLDGETSVTDAAVRYKCRWSPFAGQRFRARICSTFVNGVELFDGEQVLCRPEAAQRLRFNRR
ncbi:dihydroorotase [Marinobacterium jannaschii]|uniref:dihydroorotase n=1 Tax=Marinobacterium jannaschii TaxID=64970 RepID=UPI00048582B4|nr:dihydroorotase [Marinobacterium jannaschii]